MGQLTQYFQPPLYWQQFEDLTQSVAQTVFDVPYVQKVGRPGQAQDGVDLYAQTNLGNLGIQCKRLDEFDENNHPYPGGPITKKLLSTEAEKALRFSPKLNTWILATTAKRDATAQKFARALSAKYQEEDKFTVLVWFWDDFVTWLNTFSNLQAWYYNDVIKIRNAHDQDRLILETIATAFHRPAFTTPLGNENLDDLLQALTDTQTALRTGELRDRETRHVIRRAVGGWRQLDDSTWQARLKDLDGELNSLRQALVTGLKEGLLKQHRGYLEVKDQTLGHDLDTRRQRCIIKLNDLLGCASLPLL